MFEIFCLNGDTFSTLNTEIRYIIASAHVDGRELIELEFATSNDDFDRRRMSCINKVLRALKKSSNIQFYVYAHDIDSSSMESIYLLNKFSKYIEKIGNDRIAIYIKL